MDKRDATRRWPALSARIERAFAEAAMVDSITACELATQAGMALRRVGAAGGVLGTLLDELDCAEPAESDRSWDLAIELAFLAAVLDLIESAPPADGHTVQDAPSKYLARAVSGASAPLLPRFTSTIASLAASDSTRHGVDQRPHGTRGEVSTAAENSLPPVED